MHSPMLAWHVAGMLLALASVVLGKNVTMKEYNWLDVSAFFDLWKAPKEARANTFSFSSLLFSSRVARDLNMTAHNTGLFVP